MRALACTDVVVIAEPWSEPVVLKRGIWTRQALPETTSCHCPAGLGEDCPLNETECFARAENGVVETIDQKEA